MPTALGLSTYRWNNNIKSMLLLAVFPFLLLTLLGGIFYLYGAFYAHYSGGVVSPYLFANFHLPWKEGGGRPLDFALSAVITWWPIVLGVALVWLVIGYAFNDDIIHAATGAKAVTRAEEPKLYNLL